MISLVRRPNPEIRQKPVSKRCTRLFILAYSLILAYSFIGLESFIGPILKSLTNVSVIIFIGLFLCSINRFRPSELGGLFLLAMLGMIVSSRTHDDVIIKLVLMTLAFKKVDFRLCIKYDMWIRLILICITIGLCMAGLLVDATFGRGDEAYRHSFGFSNPNTLSIAAFIMCMEFLYIYGNRHRLFKIALVLAIVIIINHYTDSRTSLYAFIVFILLVRLYQVSPRLFMTNKVKRLIQFTPLAFALITLLLARSFMNDPMSDVANEYNDLTSGRIKIISIFATKYSPSFFGNDISPIDISLDNAYAYMWLCQGIVITILFFIGYWLVIERRFRQGDIMLVLILFSLATMGLAERLWTAIDYNLLMITFGVLFFRNERPAYRAVQRYPHI